MTKRTPSTRRSGTSARADRRDSPDAASWSIGDLIADEFIYGEIARVSREAPVLILELRLDRDRAGRRRQRREQRGRARRAAARRRRGRPRRDGPAAARRSCPRASTCARRASAPARLPHADQDAHPRRRHPFRQAAGRPHRSRAARRPSTTSDRARVRARALLQALRRVATRCSCRTTARAWSRRRSLRDRARGGARGTRGRPGPRRLALRAAAIPRHDRLHAERIGSRAGARHPDRRRTAGARAGGPRRCSRGRDAGGAHHARQPRHGAVRAGTADGPHPDLRLRPDRRRHRRRRHRDRDDDAGAGGGRDRSTRRRAWPTTPAGWSS